jgi:hypothetical protein
VLHRQPVAVDVNSGKRGIRENKNEAATTFLKCLIYIDYINFHNKGMTCPSASSTEPNGNSILARKHILEYRPLPHLLNHLGLL